MSLIEGSELYLGERVVLVENKSEENATNLNYTSKYNGNYDENLLSILKLKTNLTARLPSKSKHSKMATQIQLKLTSSNYPPTNLSFRNLNTYFSASPLYY